MLPHLFRVGRIQIPDGKKHGPELQGLYVDSAERRTAYVATVSEGGMGLHILLHTAFPKKAEVCVAFYLFSKHFQSRF